MAERKPKPKKTIPPIVAHALELFADNVPHSTPPRCRAMFGGWGIWVGEPMVALITDEVLYLKTHPQTMDTYIQAGCKPFVYEKSTGEQTVMSYYTAPESSLDSANAFRPWALRACHSAALAKAKN